MVSPTTLIPAGSRQAPARATVGGIEPRTLGRVASLDWTDGSDEVVANLAPDEAIFDENFAEQEGVGVGDGLEITGPSGDVITVTIAGITTRSRFIVDQVALTRDTVLEQLGARDDTTTPSSTSPKAPIRTTREQVDALLAERFERRAALPGGVQAGPRERDQPADRADLRSSWPLRPRLDLRRRQHALADDLRAHPRARHAARDRHLASPGTAHDPLRVRGGRPARSRGRRRNRPDHAVAAVRALEDEGLELSISPSLPLVVLIAAILIEVVAAIGPARRASRLDVIQALQCE